MPKAGVRRLLGEREPIVVVGSDPAQGIDQHGPRVRENHAGIGFEGGDAALEMAWLAQVVGVMPAKETSPRFGNDEVVVPGSAAVGLVPDITDTPIGSGVAAADVRRAVVGTVVGDDDLEVAAGLCEK